MDMQIMKARRATLFSAYMEGGVAHPWVRREIQRYDTLIAAAARADGHALAHRERMLHEA